MSNAGSTELSLSGDLLREIVRRALEEDVHTGDVTTLATVPATTRARGMLVARQPGVVAGLPVARAAFEEVDGDLVYREAVQDGAHVEPGTLLAEVEGRARSVLIGERVALNFLQRLSGIATLTARYVARISGSTARIVDTRKTTPGLRALEKYAVRVGGGRNHRMGLYDAVLIKDNHIEAAGSISRAVRSAREAAPHTMTVTVECDTLEQVDEALAAGADILLLDNMDLDARRQAVLRVAGRALTEASGGITLETVAEVAAVGVDIISVGALTHSAPALDIGLDLQRLPG